MVNEVDKNRYTTAFKTAVRKDFHNEDQVGVFCGRLLAYAHIHPRPPLITMALELKLGCYLPICPFAHDNNIMDHINQIFGV